MRDYKNILKVVCFLIVVTCSSALAQTNSDYNSSPPFLATAVEPNILIVLDNSGSMCDQAYASSYDPSGFTNGQYYGYFDGSKNYQYTSNGRWEETSAALTTGTTANPIASGSFLNWATMRRVEVAKKLLIGGKASPRSPTAGVTVKLNAETACSSSWDFQKDYDTTGQSLIYPFNGNYRFTRTSDDLSASPIGGGTNTFYTYPNGNISVPAGWAVFPAASNAWADVDETTSDDNTTYIQNSNTTSPVMLSYNYTQSEPAGTITVTIKVTARKTASGATRNIQGVLTIDGVNYESNTSSIGTGYSLYSLGPWTTNPATGAAWQWSEIKSIAVSGNLQGFGVKASANYTSSPYPRITQVYLDVSVTTPSGGPYNTIVDQGMTKAEGIIDNLGDEARFGLAFYNNGRNSSEGCSGGGCEDGGYVANDINFGSATNMITSIHNMAPETWTPLGETLYEMVRYFRQDSPYYTGNSPADYQIGLSYDPYYFDYPSSSSNSDQYAPCAKSFVLMLTDGESTQDTNIPTSIKGYSTGYRFAGTAVGTTYSSYGRDYLIDVAFWARKNDMRSGSCTTTPTSFQQCLPGTQSVILYPVFMFGTGSTLLKDAAITGGFNDRNSNNLPDCATIPEECYRDSDEDGVVESNGNDLPITYFEGDDGYALETNITNAITDMLKRSASGTSVSVLTTSASGAGDIFQCYFLPSKTVNNEDITWLGHLLQLGVSSKGEILDSSNRVITFSFNDTEGQTYVNVTGVGNYPLIEWTGYKWDAGEKLVTKTATSRVIKSFIDANKNGAVDSGEFISFEEANKTTLKPYLRATDDTESANIINFIRGSEISGYRDRTYSGTNQYKLGDIIYSTPTVISSPAENYGLIYGDKTYSQFFESWKSRDTVVIIGANDGMLHAFKSSDGNELWAFIPQNLLPHLKWLTDPDYSHVYYVDLRARVTDINFGDTTSPNWKTVLIGGMRLGGGQISVTDNFGAGSETRNFQSSYFAIDITNPNSPNLLWEFTHSDLGFTTSYPTIAKVGNKWFIVVGSGPKSSYVPDYTGASTQTGRVFVLDARNTGAWTLNSTYWVFDTGVSNSFMGDPLAVDIDFENGNTVSGDTTSYTSYNTEVIYIGITYDIGGTPRWRGNLYRLVINGNVNPGSWNFYKLFDGNPLSSATPITTSPAATVDELDNLWVYFGTGRFYSQDDKSTITKHAFFGIRDSYWSGAESKWKPCWDGSTWSTDTQCTTSGIASTSSLYNGGDVTQVVADEGTVTSTAWGSISWDTFVQNVSATSTYRGWYAELAAGSTGVGAERVITKPGVIGGTVLFTAFIPQTDVCSYGGTSNLYSLYYKTGTAYKESTIGTTTSGSQTVVLKSTSLGYGMASSPAIHVGQEEGGTAKAFIQTSTGEIKEITYQLKLIRSGVISWKEVL